MTVVLDIPDRYGNVLTVTAVGVHTDSTQVTTVAVDLKKNTYLRIDENGKVHYAPKEVNT